MSGQLDSLIGRRFGRLVVINELPRQVGVPRRFLCRCDCGNNHQARGGNLLSGGVQSCGCLKHQAPQNMTHGQKGTRLYRIWVGMKTRCFNPRVREYPRYGGRGITVCDAWMDFAAFHRWALANGYQDDLTIERIDNDGPYSPENCRWIPLGEQARNRRNNRLLTYGGETKPLSEWAEIFGISVQALWGRLRRGWPIERALLTPSMKRKEMAQIA